MHELPRPPGGAHRGAKIVRMDPPIGSAEHQRQHKMLRDLYAVHERTKTAEEISFTLDEQYSYVAHIRGPEPALAESVFNGM